MRQKEGILDDKIISYCHKNNIYAFKTNGNGKPDIIMCIEGLFVAFETKVDDNVLSPLQIGHIKKIKKSNGIVYEIRSYKEAITVIDNIKRNKN